MRENSRSPGPDMWIPTFTQSTSEAQPVRYQDSNIFTLYFQGPAKGQHVKVTMPSGHRVPSEGLPGQHVKVMMPSGLVKSLCSHSSHQHTAQNMDCDHSS